LVVANPSSRVQLTAALARLGFDCAECDDPYTATLELCRRRLAYRALIVSLAGLFRSELALITTVKRRFPHVEVWLAHTDGRQADLAESMRLGADGLLDDEGFHRIASTQPAEPVSYPTVPQTLVPLADTPEQDNDEPAPADDQVAPGEPVLTVDELRALLQDPPVMPPSAGQESDS
jgi:hypothetical protein